jgi:hypothetical protein
MRHVPVHDYFEVDRNEFYNVDARDIPVLGTPIQAVLNLLPPFA